MKNPNEMTDEELGRERSRLVEAYSKSKLPGEAWKGMDEAEYGRLLQVVALWTERRQKRWAHLKTGDA